MLAVITRYKSGRNSPVSVGISEKNSRGENKIALARPKYDLKKPGRFAARITSPDFSAPADWGSIERSESVPESCNLSHWQCNTKIVASLKTPDRREPRDKGLRCLTAQIFPLVGQ